MTHNFYYGKLLNTQKLNVNESQGIDFLNYIDIDFLNYIIDYIKFCYLIMYKTFLKNILSPNFMILTTFFYM